MRCRVLAILLVACESRVPDPVPAPIVPIADRHDAAVAPPVDALVPDAALGPSTIELRGTSLVGPFASLAAACRAAPPCGGTVYNEATSTIDNPPKRPDCSEDPNHPKGLATSSAVIKPVLCATPPEIRGSEAQYYLFLAHRGQWWRSGVLFSLAYNEKYCGGEVRARWESGGPRTIARLRVEQSCLDCAKNGDASDALDVLIVADRSRDVPSVFPPVITGQHFERTPRESVPPDVECRPERRDVTLIEGWRGDILELRGTATWREARLDPLLVWPDKTTASSAGTYELVLP